VPKDKLHLGVHFNAAWINGYLSRGGERWGQFRRELHSKLVQGLRPLSPCSVLVGVHASSWPDLGYSIRHGGTFGAAPPTGSNARAVRRRAEEIVAEHMKSYTFGYQKETRS